LNEPTGKSNPSASLASKNDSLTSASQADSSFVFLILIVIFLFGLPITLKVVSAIRRKRRLVDKYGEEIATLIIARKLWQGMTEEQLTDSWGNPADVGREIIRSKIKQTWKYG